MSDVIGGVVNPKGEGRTLQRETTQARELMGHCLEQILKPVTVFCCFVICLYFFSVKN